MDSDARLSFISMKDIEVTEYGYAPVTYSGTYSIDQNGTINVRLKDYPSNWVSMRKRSTEHLSHFWQRAWGYGIYATRLSMV